MYTLILNLGLKSIRAIVFDQQGNKVKQSNLPISTYLKGSFIEQNPEEWWDKAKTVISNVLRDSEIRNSIKYISITSSSSCLVTIDKDGKTLGNSMMVSDKRSIKEVGQIEDIIKNKFPKSEIKVSTALMLPKILWLKNSSPKVFQKANMFLSSNDYLFLKFTGEVITDELNAEKFNYNCSNRDYPLELLKELGISRASLPDVAKVGGYSTPILNEIKNEFQLFERPDVVISTYDAICAYWGSGGEPDVACEVSGTVTSLRVLTNKSLTLKELFTQSSSIEDHYLVGGSNNLGGGLIEWTKQSLYSTETYPYEIMEREAKKAELGAGGLLFLPYLMGERSPIWDENARGVFFGLDRSHNRENMVKAIFESTAFSVRTILEILENNDISVKKINVSGGLTRIGYINQLKADILNKEIHICDEFETTSLGAFLIVLLHNKSISGYNEMKNFLNIRSIVIPNKKNVEKYNEIFPLFIKLYKDLKDLFVQRGDVYSKIQYEFIEKIENL